MKTTTIVLASLLALSSSYSLALDGVTCTMREVQPNAGSRHSVRKSVAIEQDAFAGSRSLDFRGGSYSFEIGFYDVSELNVIINENQHVQDEVGSFSCDMSGVRAGRRFCVETIEAESFDSDENETLHAFDFWCVAR